MSFQTLTALVVKAHPDVSQGREYYDQAEFQKAISAFDRAQRSSSLSFEDLTDLLLSRALAHQALGDDQSAEGDFEALLSIAPNAELDESTPPSRRKMFADIKRNHDGTLAVEVQARDIPDGVRLEADVTKDPARLVRSVRITYREDGGSWHVEKGSRVNIPTDEDIEYYAEAIGPGGTVLGFDGTRDDPRQFKRKVGGGSPDTPIFEKPTEKGSSRTGLWIGIGVGAAALVAIIVLVVALSGSTNTQPSIPTLVN